MSVKNSRKTIQFPDHELHREIMVLAAQMCLPAPEVIRKAIEALKKTFIDGGEAS